MKIITGTASKTQRGRGLTIVWGIHPFGRHKLLVALCAKGLCWAGLNCGAGDLARNWPGAELVEDRRLTAGAAREIAALWPGKLDRLATPLYLAGTEFQLKVWKQLLKIKPGETRTYGEIAKKIGSPAAVRAVGSAVGKNPLSIIVPCHRVVNGDGRTVNYAWGPAIKTELLKKEGAA